RTVSGEIVIVPHERAMPDVDSLRRMLQLFGDSAVGVVFAVGDERPSPEGWGRRFSELRSRIRSALGEWLPLEASFVLAQAPLARFAGNDSALRNLQLAREARRRGFHCIW